MLFVLCFLIFLIYILNVYFSMNFYKVFMLFYLNLIYIFMGIYLLPVVPGQCVICSLFSHIFNIYIYIFIFFPSFF